MKRTPLFVTLLVAGTAGCGLLHLNGEPDPEERLEAAVTALEQRDLARAKDQLLWLYEHYPNAPAGRRAVLLLSAAELNPRNPNRDIRVGSDMAARLLTSPGTPVWMEPIAETLYLLSLELGANEERIRQAEAERDSANALPELPGPSFTAQLQTVRAERDSFRTRVRGLEQVVATKEKELKEKEQELERIRKTLKG